MIQITEDVNLTLISLLTAGGDNEEEEGRGRTDKGGRNVMGEGKIITFYLSDCKDSFISVNLT